MGPGGNFLVDDHTLKHFRSEFWFPTIIDRNRRENWEDKGKTTMAERAQARVVEILSSHKPEPLSDGANMKIAQVLARADTRLGSQQS